MRHCLCFPSSNSSGSFIIEDVTPDLLGKMIDSIDYVKSTNKEEKAVVQKSYFIEDFKIFFFQPTRNAKNKNIKLFNKKMNKGPCLLRMRDLKTMLLADKREFFYDEIFHDGLDCEVSPDFIEFIASVDDGDIIAGDVDRSLLEEVKIALDPHFVDSDASIKILKM